MITVMTWNVQNLFTPPSDAQQSVRGRFEDKLADLARVVAEHSPDLLALQEVGDTAAFDDLLAALGDGWYGVPSQLPDERGIRVAWAARTGRFAEPRAIAEYPQGVPPVTVGDDGETIRATRRGALAVRWERGDGFALDALTAHFKSKLLSFPPAREGGPTRFATRDEGERARYGFYALNQRAAEAVTVRAWATKVLGGEGQKRAVLVCGDLNDGPQAATTQLLQGPEGSELGTRGFDQKDQGDATRLWNLAPRMPDGQDWSRVHAGREELLDQFLVSHLLVNALGSARAVAMDVPSVTAEDPQPSGRAPSDHRPVVATFDV